MASDPNAASAATPRDESGYPGLGNMTHAQVAAWNRRMRRRSGLWWWFGGWGLFLFDGKAKP